MKIKKFKKYKRFKCELLQKLYYLIVDIPSNIQNVYLNTKNGISNLVFLISSIWGWKWWDFTFSIIIFNKLLDRHIAGFEDTKKCHILRKEADRIIKQMKIVKLAISRLDSGSYEDYIIDKLHYKYPSKLKFYKIKKSGICGMSRMSIVYNNPEDEKQYRRQKEIMFKIHKDLREMYFKLLFKNLKQFKSWWD